MSYSRRRMRYPLKAAVLCSLVPSLGLAEKVEFTTQIQPILSENCYACHGPDEATMEGGLRLDVRELALKGGDSGNAIVPGDPAASLILERITHSDPDEVMPPPDKKKRLKPEQIDLIRQWIDEGAEWGVHWAFKTPERPSVPKVQDKKWVKNAIDQFVLSKLEAENLKPMPPADRHAFLRRLSLDLIGLPPSLEELDSAGSAEKEIDRLIASPHFGERWGREWLDAARYSDSAGYEKDLPRFHHFYRDWVVDAMNSNMPYDQFVIKQIAGDLLPEATQADRIATGFLRNSMTNEEGGANPEQFRIEGVFDRIDAIGKSMLGLTAQCAQCHTHKYDPLTHDEYFGMYAYLNGIEETSIAALSETERRSTDDILAEIAAIDRGILDESPEVKGPFETWQREMLGLPRTQWRALELYQIGDSGQKYRPLPDKSVINSGYANTRGTETFSSSLQIPVVRAARLELMNDPYLPMSGPGRSTRGTGALSEFVMSAGKDQKSVEALKFVNPIASVNPPVKALDHLAHPSNAKRQPDDRKTGPAKFLLDGDNKTAWTNERDPARNHDPAVFTVELEQPFESDGTAYFKYSLVQRHGGFNSDDNQTFNLGRIRLSVSSTLPNALDQLPPLVLAALETPADQRSAEQSARLFAHWREMQPDYAEQSQKIEELYAKVPAPTWALVAGESEKDRVTRLFERGEQTQPKHVVTPHVPAFLHPLPPGNPESRLTFAKWLVDPASPVAARVMVNRIWQAYFGTGLLETSEDFGHQAAAPSHPELLDWLAVEFMESGWDMKHIHRLITSSATYRQDSIASASLRDRDPANRLLARGPRFRVPAETVRNIQLASSGLLDTSLGGRSVFPPAPRYLFERPVSYGPKTWPVEMDSQRYRRALYTFRFRSVPYPMLATFDAPNGAVSCVRRTVSTTPLQALVTLNEQVSLEAALGLADLILKDSGKLEDRLAKAFVRCTSREPEAEEVAALVSLYQSSLSPDPAEAELFRESYQPVTLELSGHKLEELFAAAAVARTLLNLDETITKN
ncbi:MAG: PSD1 and planctomycete cytochrome C domain-containing protein [Akkermansiaceae bacterium]